MINTFLITGATKGLGRAIALHLVNLKYRVYAIGRNKLLLDDLAHINPLICPVQCDITKFEDVSNLVKILGQEDSFSIIHNAAIVKPRIFTNDHNNELLRKQIETNFIAPLNLTQKLLPLLKSGQRVLHISSQAAELALPGLMGYCISKAALEQATRCLNAELADRKILFSIFRPGMVDTPMQDQLRESSLEDLPGRSFYIESYNQEKLNNPGEVAKFVSQVMLHSSDEDYVNTVWDVRACS
jgi:NAD(P)-dependent dehydrogenase (short-subunit alcohol dehydrogenase family)